MDIITVLSFAIFIATVITIVMAGISYAAFKIRDWRRPEGEVSRAPEGAEDTLFFRKYVPPAEEMPERDTNA